MIDRLNGTLVECEVTGAVVDVGGVGYALTIPMSTYDRLPRIGTPVLLLTHLHVREDAMQLFAFSTSEERRLFRLLITVSGVGPRLALNVLSCMPVGTFCKTIAQGDIKSLTRVNGLGKKSAERLIVELKGRIDEIDPEAALGSAGEPLPQAALDAIAALETLGFKADKARKTVDILCTQLPQADHSAENLIRKALQQLNS